MLKTTCMLVCLFNIFVFTEVSSAIVGSRHTRTDMMPMNYFYDDNDEDQMIKQLDAYFGESPEVDNPEWANR